MQRASVSIPEKPVSAAARCRSRCVRAAPAPITSTGTCFPRTRIRPRAILPFRSASRKLMDGLGEATIGPMAVIRAIHFIATAMTAGALIFRLGVAEPVLRSAPAAAPVVRRQVLLVAWIGLAVAVASGVRWLQLEAVSMSGLPFNEAMTWDVLSTVVNETQFGLVSKIRFGLAIILAVCLLFDRLAPLRWLALGSAIGVLAAIAWTGHAGTTAGKMGDLHLAADALHLIAAAAWIGGLVPLALLLSVARGNQA